MKLIFGFDLGSTSIGWAVVQEKENDTETSRILKLGVRVNPLTTDEKTDFEKGKPITTNANRRLVHGMRLNLSRYKQRRKELIKNLIRFKFISPDTVLCENGSNTTFETLRLRAKAATEEITLEELSRVLLMINKKRGYKSNRKAQPNDNGAIDNIDIAKKLYQRHLTPGEYVFNNLKQGIQYIPPFYRSDLINEFNKIVDCQTQFYPHLKNINTGSLLKAKNCDIILDGQDVQRIKQKGCPSEKKRELYCLRAQAATQQIRLEELALVLEKISSEIRNSSGYLGDISDRSKELFINNQTIGQYLMSQLDRNPNNKLKGQVFYRQDYEDEFNRIWETQARFHKELTPERLHIIRDIIIFFQRDLKSQKSNIAICEFEKQKREITVDGKKKIIEFGPKVCPKSSPIFQEFKIWQTINNLKISNIYGEELSLSSDERQILFEELSIRKKLTCAEILKLLHKDSKCSLNYKEIQGNATISAIFDAFKEIILQSGHDNNNFNKASFKDTMLIIEPIFKMLGINTDILSLDCPTDSPSLKTCPIYQLWHLLYSYAGDNSKTGDSSLIKKLQRRYGFSKEYASIMSKISFDNDYGNLSAKAIMRILPHLRNGLQYSDACNAAGYNHSKRSLTKQDILNKVLVSQIDLLPRNSLRQPVVEKILNQLINITNALISTYGNPDEIRIELARELKKSADERAKLNSANNANEKGNNSIRKLLQERFGIQNPSRNDIVRYKLYKELEHTGFKTLYSQSLITDDILFSKEIEIEHIIPQARLFDDSLSNKTLEFHNINQNKSNQTAYDYILSEFGEDYAVQYKKRIDDLLKNGKISRTKHKYLLMSETEIPTDFINRDIRETQYISRKAMEILEPATRKVVASSGAITARLREDWQLVDVMKELNWEKYKALNLTETIQDKDGRRIYKIKDWTKRNDHRHHAMDALTVAFTKPSFIQFLNNLNARSDKGNAIYAIQQKELHRNKDGKLCFNPPLPLDEFRAEAKRQLNDIFVSHKAKNKVATRNSYMTKNGKGTKIVELTPRGQLFNETTYGCVKQYETKLESVNSSFDTDKIMTVADKSYRQALMKRIEEFDGNASLAFSRKNSITKNPIYVDDSHSDTVPVKVKTVVPKPVFTQRIAVDIKLDKTKIAQILDAKIRRILTDRFYEFGEDPQKAFSNIDENPIWLNKEKGIAIKKVTIKTGISGVPIRHKRNNMGRPILNSDGNKIPSDFVVPGNNHHIAIYKDADGNIKEQAVPFYIATNRVIHKQPAVDRNFNADKGWKFLFSIKKNEYFVFPNEKTGFNPAEIDLLNPNNNKIISPNLFRVQKISSSNYYFRHHLETTIDTNNALNGTTWKHVQSLKALENIIKVRVNNIGQIVAVGEY